MIALLAACGLAAAIEPVLEPLGDGKINWTTLELLASARGRPQAGGMFNLETLEDDARGRLGPVMLTLARQVRIDRAGTVGDVLSRKDDLAWRVDDNLSLWEVYEVRYYTSGAVEIDGALPLQGLVRPVLLDGAEGKERGGVVTGTTTGLVVDVRGLELQPAMAPRVLDPEDELLYGLATLTEAAASARGPAIYVHDPADVAAVRRAGGQPLFVRAEAVIDGTDVRLSAAEAAALREAAASSPFLLRGSVVFVVGPAPEGVPTEPEP